MTRPISDIRRAVCVAAKPPLGPHACTQVRAASRTAETIPELPRATYPRAARRVREAGTVPERQQLSESGVGF
jgi:hypothetical protein